MSLSGDCAKLADRCWMAYEDEMLVAENALSKYGEKTEKRYREVANAISALIRMAKQMAKDIEQVAPCELCKHHKVDCDAFEIPAGENYRRFTECIARTPGAHWEWRGIK